MNEPHEAPPPKPPPPPPPPTTGETTAHLEVPFEDTYLVGLPPGTVPSRAGCEAKINPWCEQSCTRTKLDQKRSLSAFHTALQSYSNDYHEALLSLANPIDYNPRHPAQIPIATQFKRSLSHARYSGRQSARRLPSPQLLLPPAQSSDAILIGQAHSGPSLFQPPTFTTPPIIQYYQDDMTDQKQQHSSAQRNNDTSQSIPSIMNPPITHQPRFAGAPNFIRFNNGTPQPQLLDGYSPPCLLPQMPLSAPHLARHTLPNIIRPPSVMRPVINLQQAHSSGRPNVSQHPAHSGDLTSRAQPVRPPLEDFMRYISNTVPGLSFDQLLQLFQQSSNPNSIRLNVPPNVDLTTLQNNLEQARHLIMGMHNSTPLQYQHQQQPRPQPPPTNHPPTTPIAAAAINNLTLNNARPPLPTEDDMVLQDLHADADNDEEYHEIETYSDYRPVKLKLGKAHPDPVVETSSLSTVEPPDINYHLKLPEKVIEGALLSSLQLESVIYACQQHAQLMPDKKTRRGFLIGDGAGVGKGRTIAGIIYENYLNGRKKSIWLSVSSDLKLDAERDLKDIGAKVPVFLLNKFQYGRRINEDHGVIFTTYSGLVSKSQSVKGNYGSRLGQLVSWAGNNFDGVIVFDECHKAKNISMGNKKSQKISKAAEYVLEIQEKLPNARIVYASATGASETRHLGYMARLGIWGPGTPYVNFPYFCECIEKRGVGAMELVAVELKMRGSYIARQLSFKTTSFSILRATLSDDFIKLYDECVEMWSLALVYFREAENYFSGNKKLVRTLWSSFWAAHQKFFKYLCISAKVPMVVEIARQSLEAGKCVVIGLQSTGEAKTLEALDEGEINEFISTAKATFESLIDNHFPAPVQGKRRRQPSTSTESDFNPYIANTPSNKSSSTNSSSTIDETWGNTDSCKFIIKDGVALPKIVEGPSTTRRSCRVARKQSAKSGASESLSTTNMNSIDRKQNALYELVKAKKAETKSARTLRHKRRLAIRQGDKSRIKKTSLDDTDTEISDPLSGSPEHLLSDSSLTISQSSGSDYEADTVTEFDGSDDELMVVGTKSARAKKVNSKIIEEEEEEDSGDDVRITAVKEIVTIDSDPETSPMDESDSAHEGQVNDPMVTHGTRLTQMQNELYAKIDALGPRLPNNTLDDLIDRLGGPDFVAEMTGRKGRVVKDAYGRIKYKQRNEVDCADNMNIEEKKRFMDGEKFIAIISEAASSGISLQADKRVKNTRRRVHITIELPWSADRAIQQFGRTHRSNQSSGPEYVFIISELAGETRFASIVAKRLESLGALTHGDRRATTDSRDLSQFNMTSKYCRNALELMAKLLDFNHHFADIRPNYKQGDFVKDAREAYVGTGLAHYGYGGNFNTENVALNINVFLNRLLGMKVNIQNAVFDLFVKITDRLITRRKVAGEFDAGILELNSASGKMKVEEPETFLLKTSSTIVRCSLRHVRYERGITWEDAKARLEACQDDDLRNGFYLTTNSTTKARLVILVVRESLDMFRIFKPNVGRQPKLEYFSTVTEKFTKASSNLREAERVWRYIYVSTDTNCVHMCYFNSCKRIEAKMKCDVGIRHRLFYILSGGILTTWPYLERRVPEATRRINIVRLRLDDDTRVIGPSIPLDLVDKVRAVLREGEINGIEFNTKK